MGYIIRNKFKAIEALKRIIEDNGACDRVDCKCCPLQNLDLRNDGSFESCAAAVKRATGNHQNMHFKLVAEKLLWEMEADKLLEEPDADCS